MAHKRKQDSNSATLQVELNKLEVSPSIHALLEVDGLLEFLKKFNDQDEDITKQFLKNWHDGATIIYGISFQVSQKFLSKVARLPILGEIVHYDNHSLKGELLKFYYGRPNLSRE